MSSRRRLVAGHRPGVLEELAHVEAGVAGQSCRVDREPLGSSRAQDVELMQVAAQEDRVWRGGEKITAQRCRRTRHPRHCRRSGQARPGWLAGTGLSWLLQALRLRTRRSRQHVAATDVGHQVSEGTIRNRVNRLNQHGVMRIVAVTDPRKLGSPIDCLIGLEVDLRQIHAAAARLTQCSELRYVGIATGPFDIIIAGDFRSEEHLLDFVTRTLASIDGIKRSETARILHVHKRLFESVSAPK
jgi:Lrp/AsnC family transcriptional regulator for asnA, asnC and gidA